MLDEIKLYTADGVVGGNIFKAPTTQAINDAKTTNERVEVDGGIFRGALTTSISSLSSFYNDFTRYGKIFPDEEQSSLTRYVFLVKPDCNIIGDDGQLSKESNVYEDPTFQYLYETSPGMLDQLCNSSYRSRSVNRTNHDLIPFLVGRTNNFSVGDYSLSTYEDSQVFTGYKFVYPGNANVSQSGVQFDLEIRDDSNMNVLKFFYAWCYYIDGVVKGKFIPRNEYVGSKIADYMTSLYYFVCGPDGSEILYYHKIVGCFPTGVPFSFYSMNGGGGTDVPRLSFNFTGAAPESLNPIILSEFNANVGLYDMMTGSKFSRNGGTAWIRNNTAEPVNFNTNTVMQNTGKPFIASLEANQVYIGGRKKYFLMFANRGTE